MQSIIEPFSILAPTARSSKVLGQDLAEADGLVSTVRKSRAQQHRHTVACLRSTLMNPFRVLWCLSRNSTARPFCCQQGKDGLGRQPERFGLQLVSSSLHLDLTLIALICMLLPQQLPFGERLSKAVVECWA